jgi:hypothetical protein
MKWLHHSFVGWLIGLALLIAEPALAQMDCHDVDPAAEKPMQQVDLPPSKHCIPKVSNGFPLPDPSCTPGAINPGVTTEVLQDRNFKTRCVRDGATSSKQKNTTYNWYNIPHPSGNTGQNQVCELDHLISLELGGADTLDNIWPQCGANDVELNERYFKRKDAVENYLAAQVKSGAMDLAEAQSGIAKDWTQYLEAAQPSEGIASAARVFEKRRAAAVQGIAPMSIAPSARQAPAKEVSSAATAPRRYARSHVAPRRYAVTRSYHRVTRGRYLQLRYYYFRCDVRAPQTVHGHCVRIAPPVRGHR